MEEIYKLLIDYKEIYPLSFWIFIILVPTILTIIIWTLTRKKKSSIVEQPKISQINRTVFIPKENSLNRIEKQKNTSISEVPPTVIYENKKTIQENSVSEPKFNYTIVPKEKPETIPVKVEEPVIKQKSKPKETLPTAKLEPLKSKGIVQFVNYDLQKVESIDSYPVLRFPKKGTVVRSYRLGNTKRRGFKEESFQISLISILGRTF